MVLVRCLWCLPEGCFEWLFFLLSFHYLSALSAIIPSVFQVCLCPVENVLLAFTVKLEQQSLTQQMV